MKEKDIIPYEYNLNESVSLLAKKRRKRSIGFRRFLILVLIIAAFAIVHNYKGELLAFYNQFNSFNNANTDSLADTNTLSGTENTDAGTNSADTGFIDNDQAQDTVPQDAYLITESHYTYVGINNEAMVDVESIDKEISMPSIEEIYKRYGNEAPCVLIIHSAALEAYSNGEYYTTNDDFYFSRNNVREIGSSTCQILNDNNINTIHIDDIYANGSIYSSTKEYEKALDKALKMYPSIAYVFDISRDIMINDDFTMNKPILEFNGTKMAQIKLTVGTSNLEDRIFWHKNFIFANALALKNSDLVYDLTLSSFELSQNISPIFIKVDIGSFANSINEAALAGNEFALRLCEFLKQG